ncbi:unnamed protein product [Darwinula stevensoni]|uniref:Major facilitator superfamily (MFS) profile domain-containing protein n=1 Tax=Darwinula stevensoni TaxID=69355 RepID=A0A7R9ADT3_9CRUS|nr:unnamed protein product [Darwinula stevensoni]CAG0901383.1 unnamed protein product [Darwinula stevensoni]
MDDLGKNPGKVSETMEEQHDENKEEDHGCFEFCRKSTWRERGLILYGDLVALFGFASFSIIVPFFPAAAERKGVSSTTTGLIVGVFSLVAFLLGPIVGKYLPHIGLNRAIFGGTFLSGGVCLSFGFLDSIGTRIWFTTAAFMLRILQGLGFVFYFTTFFGIIVNFFPKSKGILLASLEICTGIGLSIGPMIGGVFFNLGGFKLPFFVLGSVMIFLSFLSFKVLPSSSALDFHSVSLPGIKPLLLSFGSWVICIALALISAAWGSFYPILQPHVQDAFGMSETDTALLYVVLTCSYSITGILAGYISDRYPKWLKVELGLALLVDVLGFLLLGPVSFLQIPRSLGLLIGSLALIGISMAFTFIPTYGIMNDEIRLAGYQDSIGTATLTAGIWNSMFSLG